MTNDAWAAAAEQTQAGRAGVTGQDGAYLAELLPDKGYEVRGIKRRASLFNTDRIDHLYQDPHVEHQRFTLHYGDLTDSSNLIRMVQQVQRFSTRAAPLRWPSSTPTGSRPRQDVSATAGDCAEMASAMPQPDMPLEREQLSAAGQFSP